MRSAVMVGVGSTKGPQGIWTSFGPFSDGGERMREPNQKWLHGASRTTKAI